MVPRPGCGAEARLRLDRDQQRRLAGPSGSSKSALLLALEGFDPQMPERRFMLRIIGPSREFLDVPASMRYEWFARNSNGGMSFHERFGDNPGVGFVRFDNRLN